MPGTGCRLPVPRTRSLPRHPRPFSEPGTPVSPQDAQGASLPAPSLQGSPPHCLDPVLLAARAMPHSAGPPPSGVIRRDGHRGPHLGQPTLALIRVRRQPGCIIHRHRRRHRSTGTIKFPLLRWLPPEVGKGRPGKRSRLLERPGCGGAGRPGRRSFQGACAALMPWPPSLVLAETTWPTGERSPGLAGPVLDQKVNAAARRSRGRRIASPRPVRLCRETLFLKKDTIINKIH